MEERDTSKKEDDAGASPMIAMQIVYIMPFFFKLSSTIPPLYLSLALVDDFGASGPVAGVVMGMFQAARALVIGFTMYSPVFSIISGSIFGLLGFVCLAFYPTWHDSNHALALFSVANVLIGLTNAFSALQVFAKKEYRKDMAGLRFALRRQSVISGVACVISYFSSGILYDKYGLTSIAYLGCTCVGIASISLVFYRLRRSTPAVEEEEPDRSSESRHSERPRLSTRNGSSIRISTWQSIKHSFIDIQEQDLHRHFQEIGSFGQSLGISENDLGTIEENDTPDTSAASNETSNNRMASYSSVSGNDLGTIEENKNEDTSGASNERSSNQMTSLSSTSGNRQFDIENSRLGSHLEKAMHSNRVLASENQEHVVSEFSGAEEVVLNNIVFVVAAAFLIEALTSGSLFSVGPLYIQEMFGKSTSYTGSIFGISSAFGTIFTMVFISDKGKEIVRKIFPSSSEVYSMMLIISVSTLALIAPSFPVQFICIMFVIGFNETLWALLTEMEGAITTEKFYRTVGPGALLVHKIINIGVSFVCPVLIEIKTWLPYAFTGGLALAFSIFFVWRVERQRRKNAKLLAKVVAKRRMTMAQAKAMRMSFVTLETLTRMASVKQKRDKKNTRNMLEMIGTTFKRLSTRPSNFDRRNRADTE